MLTALPQLADGLRADLPDASVVVAPDLGASKLARRYAARLGMPVGVVSKTRLSGAQVQADVLVGDVRGLAPVVVDDMISTAGTVEAAVAVLLARGAVADVTVVATHGLFVGPADERLRALPLRQVVVTDSVPVRTDLGTPVRVHSVAALLADAILRQYQGRPLDGLLSRL